MCRLRMRRGGGKLDQCREEDRARPMRSSGTSASALVSSASPTSGFPSARRRSASPMGLPSRLDRGSKRRRGTVQIPPPKLDLTEFAGRLPRLSRHVESEEVLAGRFGLRLGLRPPAVKSQHLRVMHATVASPAARKRCSLAPLFEPCCPFAGATHFLEVATRRDRPAVHAAGRGRPEVPSRRGSGGLFDQRPTVLDLSGAD